MAGTTSSARDVVGKAAVQAPEPAEAGEAATSAHDRFPVVGLGASAGGQEAFEQFFRAMPADSAGGKTAASTPRG